MRRLNGPSLIIRMTIMIIIAGKETIDHQWETIERDENIPSQGDNQYQPSSFPHKAQYFSLKVFL